MQKNIFITRKIPEVAEKMLREKGYAVDVYGKDKIPSERKLISLLQKKPYDAVLSLLTDRINAEVFDATPQAKIYSNYAVGFDNIDLKEAKARGITVANSPAPLIVESVAEHAIGLLFSLAKRIPEGDRFVRAGKYKGWEPLAFLGTDLAGKTLAIAGAGRIGQRVAEMARALGLSVIYTDVVQNRELEKNCGAIYFKTIEEILPRADFVSLHVPLLSSTRHLINEKNLRLMKPTAFLLNTSRGAVIDEKALALALERKIIAGAGLDVYEFEPKITPVLEKMQNTVLTPHMASASATAREQMAKIAAENIIDFFEGREPKHILRR